jgi:hypothetical protein
MEIDCLQRNGTFKLQITLDCHNARPRLNYYFLPDPSHFSLPSTFKEDLGMDGRVDEGSTGKDGSMGGGSSGNGRYRVDKGSTGNTVD